MNGLWIGGFGQENIHASYGFYLMALDAQKAGDEITIVDWDQLNPMQLAGMDYISVYSYGCAALWRALGSQQFGWGLFKHLNILCGVPRFWWGQLYGGSLWTVPACFDSAKCYNLSSLPVSLPISNPSKDYVNVDLDGRGLDHVSVQDDPFVKGSIMMDLENLRKNLLEVG